MSLTWPGVHFGLYGVLLGVRGWVALSTDLCPDEAYYWEWSRAPALGYFDHPPGIAWLIRATTSLTGDTEWGIRAGPYVLSALLPFVVQAIARILEPGRGFIWAAFWCTALLPMTNAAAVVAGPDTPLAFGWALALLGMVRWVSRGQSSNWLLVTLGLGMACLSKLTGYMLVVSALSLLALGKMPLPKRGSLSLAAGALFIGLTALNLGWNDANQWITFAFQSQRLNRPPPEGSLLSVGAFLVGHLVLVGPLLAAALLRFWFRLPSGDRPDPSRGTADPPDSPRDPRHFTGEGDPSARVSTVLWWCSAPTAAWFFGVAAVTHAELNWSAPAILSALPALGWRTLSRRSQAAILSLPALLSVLALLQMGGQFWHFAGVVDPSRQCHGWAALAEEVRSQAGDSRKVLRTGRYQEAAEMAFYLGLGWKVRAQTGVGRPDQYDLWPEDPSDLQGPLLWLERPGSNREIPVCWTLDPTWVKPLQSWAKRGTYKLRKLNPEVTRPSKHTDR